MKWSTSYKDRERDELAVRDEHGAIVADLPYHSTAANARLIAAAPDMLQMLQELSTWLVCPDCAPETVEHIKARIDAVIGEVEHGR